MSKHPTVYKLMITPDGDPVATVPVLVRHHSPDGFAWGYAGSGPADLALNIIEDVLRGLGYSGRAETAWDGNSFFELSWRLHQKYKWNRITTLDRERSHEITFKSVVEFIDENGPKDDWVLGACIQRYYENELSS